MKNLDTNILISTSAGASIVAVSLGFSAIGAIIVGVAIGIKLAQIDRDKEK